MVIDMKYKKMKILFTVLFVSLFFSSCTKKVQDNCAELPTDAQNEMYSQEQLDFKKWVNIDSALQQEFKNQYNDTRTKRPLYEKYYDIIGPVAMLEFLEEKYTLCHSQAHDVGKVTYSRIKDINKSLAVCGNRCTNACMHGVVTEAFGSKSIEEIISLSKTFCESEQMNKLHKKGNCMHGLGHAFMIVSGHDIRKSIDACDTFTDKSFSYYCATGVFMEYRDNLRNKRQKLPVSTNQKNEHSHHHHHSHESEMNMNEDITDFYPCDKYNRYPAACYRYMFPLIRSKLKIDRTELINKCMNLPDIERRGCFHGLGLMYIVSVSRKPSNITKLCNQGDYEDKVMCVEGVIEKLSDMKESSALEACNHLDGKLSEVCMGAATEKMYRLNKPTMNLYVN